MLCVKMKARERKFLIVQNAKKGLILLKLKYLQSTKIAAIAVALFVGFSLVLTGCAKKETPAPQNEVSISQSSTEQPTPSKTPDSSTSAEDSTTSAQDFDPLNFATSMELFEETYPQATITSVEYKTYKEEVWVEVEGLTTEDEYGITVNALGEVHTHKAESSDRDAALEIETEGFTVQDFETLITPEEAHTAALAAKEGELRSIHLEKENGTFLYDVEVVSGTQDWEITLNATTGELIGLDD